ncbi:hypothetical protein P7C71_g4058, partial [Lecanoromycetidae sp. Uapishka_2]
MTITEYGAHADLLLLDSILANMQDMEMRFRNSGAPDDIVQPQELTGDHVKVVIDAGTTPPAPSFLTRRAVFEILWMLGQLMVMYGPRDIVKAEFRRDWRPVAMFSVQIVI